MIPKLRRGHRVAISVAALAILFRFIPVGELIGAIVKVPAGTLAATLLVVLAGHVCAAAKWRLLQGDAGLPLLTTLRAHFSGIMANLWLPGIVGGDLVRVGMVVRQSTRPAAVALASLVDRIIDSATLLLLTLAGLIAIGAPAQEARRVFVAVLLTAALGFTALVGVYWFLKRYSHWQRLEQIHQAIDLLKRRPLAVAGAFLMSFAIQAAFILVNVRLGSAVGVQTWAAVWFMAWPLSKLAALAPISAAGIGIREAAIVMLMRPFTPMSHAVMASSLIWQAVLFTGGLIGWSVLTLAASVPVGTREALLSRE